MHFIDLTYKGVRIRSWWRHLLAGCFGVIFCIPFIVLVVRGIFIELDWSFSKQDAVNVKGVVLVFLKSLIFSGIILLLAMYLLRRFWDYIANLQRICRFIYNSQFYLVNNIATSISASDKDSKVKRELVYFPKFYYRVKRKMNQVEITVQLDGSKFHRDGSFANLGSVLEELLGQSVLESRERKGYLIYCLVPDLESYRLMIDDVEPIGCTIPLMKHISWNMEKTPHALINGGTGGGKSFFLNTLLRGFLKMKAEICICDPKNSALSDYGKYFPKVYTETEDILKAVEEAVEIMTERYIKVKKYDNYKGGQSFSVYGLKPYILVIDEYVAFVGSLTKKECETFKSSLRQIVLKGRESGIFVVLATQRADSEFLSGNVRDQLGLRVTLGEMKQEGYRMAFGVTEQKLKDSGEKGRGYIYMSEYKRILDFYSPLVPEGYDFVEEAKRCVVE